MPALDRTDARTSFHRRVRAAVVVAAVAAPLGFPPRSRAQSPASPEKTTAKPADRLEGAGPRLEPFDLSFVPVTARSLFLLRPAAIARRNVERQGERSSLDLEPSAHLQVDVAPDEIEQQIEGFLWATGADADGRQRSRFTVIRAGHDLDWKKQIIESIRKRAGEPPAWVDVAFEGRSYSRLRGGKPSAWQEKWFYFPDARSVVLADEECLRQVIRQGPGSQPDLARAAGWDTIRRGLLAAAWQGGPDVPIDEISGMLMEIVGFMMPLRSEQPFRCFCGLDDRDAFHMVTRVEFRDAPEATHVALEANESLKKSRIELAAVERSGKDRKGQPLRAHLRWMIELGLNCQVRSDGSTIEMHSHCKMTLPELGDFGGRPSHPGGQQPAGPGADQRETR